MRAAIECPDPEFPALQGTQANGYALFSELNNLFWLLRYTRNASIRRRYYR